MNQKCPYAKQILWLFCSVIVTFSIICNTKLIADADAVLPSALLYNVPGNLIINTVSDNFFYRIRAAYSILNFTDLLITVSVYALIRYVALRTKAIDTGTAILAALFSITYLISENYCLYHGLIFFLLKEHRILLFLFSFMRLIGFFILFYAGLQVLQIKLHDLPLDPPGSQLPHRRQLCCMLIILISWLPWIIANYPGSVEFDSSWQLQQFLHFTPFTSHHPPLSTYIRGFLYIIGKHLVNANFGVFLYILLQTILGIWLFTLIITKLYELGLPFCYCLTCTLFYALTPIWGANAQYYAKDLLYAEVITLFLVYLADVVIKKDFYRTDALKLILTGILASLLRNNGIYAVVPTMLALPFYLKKHTSPKERKQIWISLTAIILVYGIVTSFIYPYVLNIEKGSIREAFSIPFQQTARYVKEYPAEVTEYEKQVIDAILDYEEMAAQYAPGTADPIKNAYHGEGPDEKTLLTEYFKVWFAMLRKHPGVYTSAFLDLSFGYLAPVSANTAIYFRSDAIGDQLRNEGITKVFDSSFVQLATAIVNACEHLPLIKYLNMPGFYTWLVFLCILLLIKRRMYGEIIIFIPMVINILVCIASPLCCYMRYALPTAAATPLLIGITLYLVNQKTLSSVLQK